MLVPSDPIASITHISLAGEEDWPKPVNDRSFWFQSIDRVRPIARYEFDNRTCTIHYATVRAVVQDELKGPWFDRGKARFIRKSFLDRLLTPV